MSKADESTIESSLGYIIPAHENFHFLMCLADVESELFRECSRGLDGGSFFTATLLNRKKAKLCKGKDAIDAIKDFLTLKTVAGFNQFFLKKFNLDPNRDNTPPLLKTASKERKVEYLHEKVKEALKDLLPMFSECTGILPDLKDFPVRKVGCTEKPTETSQNLTGSSQTPSGSQNYKRKPQAVTSSTFCVEEHMCTVARKISSSRISKIYHCNTCNYENSMRSVVVAHVQECCRKNVSSSYIEQRVVLDSPQTPSSKKERSSTNSKVSQADFFWNYKCGEFFLGSIFKLVLNFEKYGHGVGMYVISKMMLPLLHSLGHSNYSNTIHRFICRILTTSTPREALLLIWERFTNRNGKVGGNIFKDRRLEFRIRILKKLLRNLGPNLNSVSIQKINKIIDIKEELYYHAKKALGVVIRKGTHKSRSDEKDYNTIFKNLTDMRAHEFTPGRKFGSIEYPENILTHKRFDRSSFFRWLSKKNKDSLTAYNSVHTSIPSLV